MIAFLVRIEELFQSPGGAPLLGHLALLSSKPELDHALFIAHFLAALPHSNLPCMQPSGTSSSLGCYCSLYSAHWVIDIKDIYMIAYQSKWNQNQILDHLQILPMLDLFILICNEICYQMIFLHVSKYLVSYILDLKPCQITMGQTY